MIGYGYIYPFNSKYGSAPSFTNTYSMVFDGVDEYIACGNPTVFDGATNFSVSFWMKGWVNGTIDYPIGQITGTTGWVIAKQTNESIQISFNSGSANYVRSTTSAVNDTDWFHIIVTYDGGGGATNLDKARIYVNGSDVSSTQSGTIPTSCSASTSSAELRIARGLSTNHMPVSIDEVSIFDYTLTSTQVGYIYNSGSPTDLDDTSGVTAPVHWWRMGDGSDTISTIYDVGTTGGFNGTPINMESGDIQTDVP